MRDAIERHVQGFTDLAALVAALELGLPAALARPRGAPELARELDVEEARLIALLDALCWSGVLTCADGAYVLSEAGASALGDGPESVRVALGAFKSAAASWLDLVGMLRARGGRLPDPWPEWALIEGPEPFADRTREIARHVVERLPLAPDAPAHVVDLGCGAGPLSRAILDRYPRVRVTLVDRPQLVERAHAALSASGERVAAWGGDFLSPAAPLPRGADVVLVSNVLHSYAEAACVDVLRAAAAMLRPGGTLAVKDLRVDRTGAAPRTATDFSLHMALFAPHGRAHEALAVRGFLAEAGLVDVTDADLPAATGCFLLVAIRPGA